MFGPTKDHGQILAWALKNDAVPAEIIPRIFDSEPAILHFLFGRSKAGLPEIRPITWADFFSKFDLMGLELVFDDSPTFQLLQSDKVSLYRPV